MSKDKNQIILAKNEKIIKEYNYSKNGSKIILTDKRIISHVSSYSAFDREEMPIEDVHSLGSSYEVIKKRKGAAIFMFLLGLVLGAVGYVFGFGVLSFELSGLLASIVKYGSYVVLGVGGLLALIGLIKFLASLGSNKKVTLTIRSKGILNDTISVKAASKILSKKAQGADSSDDMVIICNVSKKDSLKMVNEIGAMVLDIKEELKELKSKKTTETATADQPSTSNAETPAVQATVAEVGTQPQKPEEVAANQNETSDFSTAAFINEDTAEVETEKVVTADDDKTETVD